MSEAISENMPRLTRGQRLLAAFVTEHCDRAAFMSSFELAAVSGVSQSTVIRFASALGYDSYTDLQQALQTELKYRLSTLERFELLEDAESDDAVLEGIAAADRCARSPSCDSSLHLAELPVYFTEGVAVTLREKSSWEQMTDWFKDLWELLGF